MKRGVQEKGGGQDPLTPPPLDTPMNPKIKYGVLIDNLENGGIKFPDFKTLLAAQRVIWIKHIIAAKDNQWKIIPSQYLFPFGGNKTIGNNTGIKKCR